MRALGILAIAVVAVVAACGGESPVFPDAAAVDAAVADASADAADVDAALIDAALIDAPDVDAAVIDAPVDAPTDAAVDAPTDAAVDAPTDAPVDAAIMTGTSCAAIHTAFPAAPDGIYTIDPDGVGTNPPFATYCDMTTDGGGWTLISYGYRQAGNTAPYYLPNADQGTWTPATRDGVAAVDARQLLGASTAVALTVTNNALVTGNVYAYAKSYVWNIPSPSTLVMTLADPSPTGCVTVSVRELHTGAAFDAQSLQAKALQVTCTGHKAGTPYERQLVGFNSAGCYGVCGSDPVTSMGMVVWYGSGYSPTTSGGDGSPERPASFALWAR